MLLNARRVAVALSLFAAVGCFKPPPDGPPPTGGGQGGGGAVTHDPVSISLQPAFLNLPLGSSAKLQVFAQQEDGTQTDVTSTAELSIDPAAVASIDKGEVKAVAAGSARIKAKLGKLEAEGAIEVPSSPLVAISFEPDQLSLGLGQSEQLAVLGRLADDSRVDVTSSAKLSVSDDKVLSIDQKGFSKALAAGSVTVTAKVGEFTAELHVTVRAAKVVGLAIEPRMPALAQGASAQLKAIASYDDQSQADVTFSATWSSSNPAVTVTPTGLVTGASAGTASVSATFQGASATTDITVRMATLTSITVTPAAPTLPPRTVRQFSASGRYSDGVTADLTSLVTWSSTAPGVAAVSNAAGHPGEVSSLAAGTADIIARLGNVQGQTRLTVTPAVLVALAIKPSNPSVRPGGTVQLSVEGTYSDSSKVDLTPQVTWSSSDPAIATIGNAAQAGLVRGVMTGSVTIRAALAGVTGSISLTVARQNPSSIEIAPTGVTIEAGANISLKAMARYPDGLVEDVSELCAWTSTPASVATVSNTQGSKGRVRGVSDGAATVEATLGSLRASTTVTVSPARVTSITVFPSTIRLPVGIYASVNANAVLSDGTTANVNGQAQWTSSAPTVARVEVFQQYYAYIEALAPGTSTITASLMGMQAQLTVTVTNASLTQVQVTPQALNLAIGATENLQAIGVFSDLSTANVTYQASWTSTNPAIAEVGDDELFGGKQAVARAPGSVTVTANFMGVSGTTQVTVSSATLMTIQVTPFAPRLPRGFDSFMRATGIYSDNTTQELTYRVSWTSSAPAVASVSMYGELQPLNAGTAAVSASLNGVTGNTTVTVTSATLQSLSVTPGMASITLGMEQPFTATGTFSDATSMDVTPYVTWLSSNRTIADVANAWPYQGSAKGLALGNTTITAVRGGVTGTAALNVH